VNLHITHVVRLRNCSSLNRLPFCGANVTLRWAICPASLPKGLPDSIVPIRQHGVQGQVLCYHTFCEACGDDHITNSCVRKPVQNERHPIRLSGT
jgi:hypothetical protein